MAIGFPGTAKGEAEQYPRKNKRQEKTCKRYHKSGAMKGVFSLQFCFRSEKTMYNNDRIIKQGKPVQIRADLYRENDTPKNKTEKR